jgi:hypothetical protein
MIITNSSAFCRDLWETVWWVTLSQPLPSQDDHARERGGPHTMALCSELLAPMQQITHSCYCGLHMLCDRSPQHHMIYWQVLQAAEDLVTGSDRFGQHSWAAGQEEQEQEQEVIKRKLKKI